MEKDNVSTNKSANLDVTRRRHAALRKQVEELAIALSLLGPEHKLVRQIAALLQPPAEEEQVPIEPWGVLGRVWWLRAGEAAGASKRQVRMAAALSLGLSQAAASRLAGYQDKSGGKATGYAAARSSAVRQLIEIAELEMRSRASRD
jgi:hypothetical protein